MGNPMLSQLNKGMMGNLSQVKQMWGMLKNAGNPQAMLQQMMSNNPQYAQIQKMISASGGDPKAAFYKLAEEKGIDPNEIINALK